MSCLKRLQRFFSGVVVVTFFVTNTLTPAPLAHASTEVLGRESQISNFTIPAEFGKVTDIVQSTQGAPLLIHIQEAHANYDAQNNIRNILGQLTKDYGIKLILLEGAGNKLTPEIFNFFPQNAPLQQAVNKKLMQAGELTGAEVFLIDQDSATRNAQSATKKSFKKSLSVERSTLSAPEAYGVENAKAYAEGREAYRSVYQGRKLAESFLDAFYLQWQRSADRTLNKPLREFLEHETAFQEERVPLQDWMTALKTMAAHDLKLDLEDVREQLEWPVLVRYFRLRSLEGKIDDKKVETEKKRFLAEINALEGGGRMAEGEELGLAPSSILHPPSVFKEVEQILESAKKHDLPVYKTRFVFERLMEALPKDFSFEAYPNLRLYIQQMILMSEIQSEPLRQEIDALSQKITSTLAATDGEKKLVGILSDYRLLKKLFKLELNREEYQQIKARGISPVKLNEELSFAQRATGNAQRKAGKQNVERCALSVVPGMQSLFGRAVEFYEMAISREDFMMQNALRRMQETKQTKAVLITGGFHTEGFKEKIAVAGNSYIGITPAIGEITNEEHRNYLRALLGPQTTDDRSQTIATQSPVIAPVRRHFGGSVAKQAHLGFPPASDSRFLIALPGGHRLLATRLVRIRSEIRQVMASGLPANHDALSIQFEAGLQNLIAAAVGIPAKFQPVPVAARLAPGARSEARRSYLEEEPMDDDWMIYAEDRRSGKVQRLDLDDELERNVLREMVLRQMNWLLGLLAHDSSSDTLKIVRKFFKEARQFLLLKDYYGAQFELSVVLEYAREAWPHGVDAVFRQDITDDKGAPVSGRDLYLRFKSSTIKAMNAITELDSATRRSEARLIPVSGEAKGSPANKAAAEAREKPGESEEAGAGKPFVEPAELDKLAEQLKDQKSGDRFGALQEIAKIGSGAAPVIPDVLHVLQDEKGKRIRQQAIASLIAMGSAAVPFFIQTFEGDNSHLKKEMAHALRLSQNTPVGFMRLIPALADQFALKDDGLTLYCADAIRQLGSIYPEELKIRAPFILGPLIAALLSNKTVVQNLIVIILGLIGAKAFGAIPALQSIADGSSLGGGDVHEQDAMKNAGTAIEIISGRSPATHLFAPYSQGQEDPSHHRSGIWKGEPGEMKQLKAAAAYILERWWGEKQNVPARLNEHGKALLVGQKDVELTEPEMEILRRFGVLKPDLQQPHELSSDQREKAGQFLIQVAEVAAQDPTVRLHRDDKPLLSALFVIAESLIHRRPQEVVDEAKALITHRFLKDPDAFHAFLKRLSDPQFQQQVLAEFPFANIFLTLAEAASSFVLKRPAAGEVGPAQQSQPTQAIVPSGPNGRSEARTDAGQPDTPQAVTDESVLSAMAVMRMTPRVVSGFSAEDVARQMKIKNLSRVEAVLDDLEERGHLFSYLQSVEIPQDESGLERLRKLEEGASPKPGPLTEALEDELYRQYGGMRYLLGENGLAEHPFTQQKASQTVSNDVLLKEFAVALIEFFRKHLDLTARAAVVTFDLELQGMPGKLEKLQAMLRDFSELDREIRRGLPTNGNDLDTKASVRSFLSQSKRTQRMQEMMDALKQMRDLCRAGIFPPLRKESVTKFREQVEAGFLQFSAVNEVYQALADAIERRRSESRENEEIKRLAVQALNEVAKKDEKDLSVLAGLLPRISELMRAKLGRVTDPARRQFQQTIAKLEQAPEKLGANDFLVLSEIFNAFTTNGIRGISKSWKVSPVGVNGHGFDGEILLDNTPLMHDYDIQKAEMMKALQEIFAGNLGYFETSPLARKLAGIGRNEPQRLKTVLKTKTGTLTLPRDFSMKDVTPELDRGHLQKWAAHFQVNSLTRQEKVLLALIFQLHDSAKALYRMADPLTGKIRGAGEVQEFQPDWEFEELIRALTVRDYNGLMTGMSPEAIRARTQVDLACAVVARSLLLDLGYDPVLTEIVSFVIARQDYPFKLFLPKNSTITPEIYRQAAAEFVDRLLSDQLEKAGLTKESAVQLINKLLAIFGLIDVYAAGDRFVTNRYIDAVTAAVSPLPRRSEARLIPVSGEAKGSPANKAAAEARLLEGWKGSRIIATETNARKFAAFLLAMAGEAARMRSLEELEDLLVRLSQERLGIGVKNREEVLPIIAQAYQQARQVVFGVRGERIAAQKVLNDRRVEEITTVIERRSVELEGENPERLDRLEKQVKKLFEDGMRRVGRSGALTEAYREFSKRLEAEREKKVIEKAQVWADTIEDAAAHVEGVADLEDLRRRINSLHRQAKKAGLRWKDFHEVVHKPYLAVWEKIDAEDERRERAIVITNAVPQMDAAIATLSDYKDLGKAEAAVQKLFQAFEKQLTTKRLARPRQLLVRARGRALEKIMSERVRRIAEATQEMNDVRTSLRQDGRLWDAQKKIERIARKAQGARPDRYSGKASGWRQFREAEKTAWARVEEIRYAREALRVVRLLSRAARLHGKSLMAVFADPKNLRGAIAKLETMIDAVNGKILFHEVHALLNKRKVAMIADLRLTARVLRLAAHGQPARSELRESAGGLDAPKVTTAATDLEAEKAAMEKMDPVALLTRVDGWRKHAGSLRGVEKGTPEREHMDNFLIPAITYGEKLLAARSRSEVRKRNRSELPAREDDLLKQLSIENIRKAEDPGQYILNIATQYRQIRDPKGLSDFFRLIRDAFAAFPPSPKILAVAGFSGSGKTTATRRLLEQHPDKFCRLIRTTTRSPRPEDAGLRNHRFLTEEAFQRGSEGGYIYGSRSYYGYHYGYSLEDLLDVLIAGKTIIMEAFDEAKELRKMWRDAQVKVVAIIPSEYKDGETDDDYKKRVTPILSRRILERDPTISADEVNKRVRESANILQLRAEADLIFSNPNEKQREFPPAFEAFALQWHVQEREDRVVTDIPTGGSSAGPVPVTISGARIPLSIAVRAEVRNFARENNVLWAGPSGLGRSLGKKLLAARSETRMKPEEVTDARAITFWDLNRSLISILDGYVRAKESEDQDTMRAKREQAAELAGQLDPYIQEIQWSSEEVQLTGEMADWLAALDRDLGKLSKTPPRGNDVIVRGLSSPQAPVESLSSAELKNLAETLGKRIDSFYPLFVEAHRRQANERLDYLNRRVVVLLKYRLRIQLLRLKQELLSPATTGASGAAVRWQYGTIYMLLNSIIKIYGRLTYEHWWRRNRAEALQRVERFRVVNPYGDAAETLYYGNEPVLRFNLAEDGSTSIWQWVYQYVAVEGGPPAFMKVLKELHYEDLQAALRSRDHAMESIEEDFGQLILHDLSLRAMLNNLKPFQEHPETIPAELKEDTATALEAALTGVVSEEHPRGVLGLRGKEAQVSDPKPPHKMLPMPGTSLETAKEKIVLREMTSADLTTAISLIESARSWIAGRLLQIEGTKAGTERKRDYVFTTIRNRDITQAIERLQAWLGVEVPQLTADKIQAFENEFNELYYTYLRFVMRGDDYRDYRELQTKIAAIRGVLKTLGKIVQQGRPGAQSQIPGLLANAQKVLDAIKEEPNDRHSEARNPLLNETIRGPFLQQAPIKVIEQWLSGKQLGLEDFEFFTAKVLAAPIGRDMADQGTITSADNMLGTTVFSRINRIDFRGKLKMSALNKQSEGRATGEIGPAPQATDGRSEARTLQGVIQALMDIKTEVFQKGAAPHQDLNEFLGPYVEKTRQLLKEGLRLVTTLEEMKRLGTEMPDWFKTRGGAVIVKEMAEKADDELVPRELAKVATLRALNELWNSCEWLRSYNTKKFRGLFANRALELARKVFPSLGTIPEAVKWWKDELSPWIAHDHFSKITGEFESRIVQLAVGMFVQAKTLEELHAVWGKFVTDVRGGAESETGAAKYGIPWLSDSKADEIYKQYEKLEEKLFWEAVRSGRAEALEQAAVSPAGSSAKGIYEKILDALRAPLAQGLKAGNSIRSLAETIRLWGRFYKTHPEVFTPESVTRRADVLAQYLRVLKTFQGFSAARKNAVNMTITVLANVPGMVFVGAVALMAAGLLRNFLTPPLAGVLIVTWALLAVFGPMVDSFFMYDKKNTEMIEAALSLQYQADSTGAVQSNGAPGAQAVTALQRSETRKDENSQSGSGEKTKPIFVLVHPLNLYGPNYLGLEILEGVLGFSRKVALTNARFTLASNAGDSFLELSSSSGELPSEMPLSGSAVFAGGDVSRCLSTTIMQFARRVFNQTGAKTVTVKLNTHAVWTPVSESVIEAVEDPEDEPLWLLNETHPGTPLGTLEELLILAASKSRNPEGFLPKFLQKCFFRPGLDDPSHKFNLQFVIDGKALLPYDRGSEHTLVVNVNRESLPEVADGSEFSARTREAMIKTLAEPSAAPLDVLVIGGGAVGAATIRDAALSGLNGALVEKDDFAGGTSSGSSKLMHGGLKYLLTAWKCMQKGMGYLFWAFLPFKRASAPADQGLTFRKKLGKSWRGFKDAWSNLKLVVTTSLERRRNQNIAPGLISLKQMFIAIAKDDKQSRVAIVFGITFYYFIALFTGQFGFHVFKYFPRFYFRKKTLRKYFPGLDADQVKAVFTFYDSHTDDARLVLETAISAWKHGAKPVSYAEVLGYRRGDDGIFEVRILDKLTQKEFKVRTKTLVNAAGPWVDQVRKEKDKPLLKLTSGIHLDVFPPVTKRSVFFYTPDGRMIFAINREFDGLTYTTIGSTDVPRTGPEDVLPTAAEVEYIIREAKKLFPDAKIDLSTIKRVQCALRPLVKPAAETAGIESTREHLIHTDPDGLISVVGVKLTDLRSAAEELMDRLWQQLRPGQKREHLTRTTGISQDSAGLQYQTMTVEHAVRTEMALHLRDWVFRRQGILPLYDAGGYLATDEQYLKDSAVAMAGLLGWGDARVQEEVADCLARIGRTAAILREALKPQRQQDARSEMRIGKEIVEGFLQEKDFQRANEIIPDLVKGKRVDAKTAISWLDVLLQSIERKDPPPADWMRDERPEYAYGWMKSLLETYPAKVGEDRVLEWIKMFETFEPERPINIEIILIKAMQKKVIRDFEGKIQPVLLRLFDRFAARSKGDGPPRDTLIAAIEQGVLRDLESIKYWVSKYEDAGYTTFVFLLPALKKANVLLAVNDEKVSEWVRHAIEYGWAKDRLELINKCLEANPSYITGENIDTWFSWFVRNREYKNAADLAFFALKTVLAQPQDKRSPRQIQGLSRSAPEWLIVAKRLAGEQKELEQQVAALEVVSRELKPKRKDKSRSELREPVKVQGHDVYTLKDEQGNEVRATNFGATVVSAPGIWQKEGGEKVVQDEGAEAGISVAGGIPLPFPNGRTPNGRMTTYDGIEVKVKFLPDTKVRNAGEHMLHGFLANVVWPDVVNRTDHSITFGINASQVPVSVEIVSLNGAKERPINTLADIWGNVKFEQTWSLKGGAIDSSLTVTDLRPKTDPSTYKSIVTGAYHPWYEMGNIEDLEIQVLNATEVFATDAKILPPDHKPAPIEKNSALDFSSKPVRLTRGLEVVLTGLIPDADGNIVIRITNTKTHAERVITFPAKDFPSLLIWVPPATNEFLAKLNVFSGEPSSVPNAREMVLARKVPVAPLAELDAGGSRTLTWTTRYTPAVRSEIRKTSNAGEQTHVIRAASSGMVGLGANLFQKTSRRSELRENPPFFVGMGKNGWEDNTWARTPDWQRMNSIMGILLDLSEKEEKIPLHDVLSLSYQKLTHMGLGVDDTALSKLLERLQGAGLILRDDGAYRLAKSARELAIRTDNAFYIKRDLEKALDESEGAFERAILEYGKIMEQWPLYPVEIQWPVLRAIALLGKAHRNKAIDILQRKEADMGYPVLVDSILLMLSAKSLEGWLRRYAPHLVGRDILYISPETIVLGGGLGRVGQYHTKAGQALAGKDAQIILVEPRYHFQLVSVVQRMREKYKLKYKAQAIIRAFLRGDIKNTSDSVEKLAKAAPSLNETQAGDMLSEAWALYEKGGKTGYFEEPIDYKKLSTPVIDPSSRVNFNVPVHGKSVEAKVFKGRTPDGRLVELVDGGPFYTRMLYRYGSIYRSATWVQFTEFFTRAALELASRLQRGKQNHGRNGKGPVLWLNDGQSAPLSVFKRIADQFSDLLTRAFVWVVTHTYRNRGGFDVIAAGLDEWWRRFFDRYGHFDSTSGGIRTADGASAVSAIHRDEVAGFDPDAKVVAITNGDDLESSGKVFDEIFRELFPGEDPGESGPAQILAVKREAIERLNKKWGWDLDPNRIVIGYSGRLVGEKAGRKRAFTDANLRDLIAAGAQVVYFGNVQDGTQSMFDLMQELADEINETGPGKLYVVTGWGLEDQRELLAAEHLQVNDSDRDPDRGTGAAEITETNGARNRALQMGPPWIEGIIQRQGIVLDWKIPGSGNTLIPAGESPKEYMTVFSEAIKQFNSDPLYFASFSETAGRLSLVLNAQLTAAAYFRKFDEGIRKKENLQHMVETVRNAFVTGDRSAPDELQAYLEDIVRKNVEWVRYEFGEEKVPAIMHLIAALTPDLLEKTKEWHPETFEILMAVLNNPDHRELLASGEVLLLSNNNKDIVVLARVGEEDNIIFPIHLGSSQYDQNDGKVWDSIFDVGRVVGSPDGLMYHVLDLSEKPGEKVPYPATRTRESLARKWRVGIPVGPGALHAQILQMKPVDKVSPFSATSLGDPDARSEMRVFSKVEGQLGSKRPSVLAELPVVRDPAEALKCYIDAILYGYVVSNGARGLPLEEEVPGLMINARGVQIGLPVLKQQTLIEKAFQGLQAALANPGFSGRLEKLAQKRHVLVGDLFSFRDEVLQKMGRAEARSKTRNLPPEQEAAAQRYEKYPGFTVSKTPSEDSGAVVSKTRTRELEEQRLFKRYDLALAEGKTGVAFYYLVQVAVSTAQRLKEDIGTENNLAGVYASHLEGQLGQLRAAASVLKYSGDIFVGTDDPTGFPRRMNDRVDQAYSRASNLRLLLEGDLADGQLPTGVEDPIIGRSADILIKELDQIIRVFFRPDFIAANLPRSETRTNVTAKDQVRVVDQKEWFVPKNIDQTLANLATVIRQAESEKKAVRFAAVSNSPDEDALLTMLGFAPLSSREDQEQTFLATLAGRVANDKDTRFDRKESSFTVTFSDRQTIALVLASGKDSKTLGNFLRNALSGADRQQGVKSFSTQIENGGIKLESPLGLPYVLADKAVLEKELSLEPGVVAKAVVAQAEYEKLPAVKPGAAPVPKPAATPVPTPAVTPSAEAVELSKILESVRQAWGVYQTHWAVQRIRDEKAAMMQWEGKIQALRERKEVLKNADPVASKVPEIIPGVPSPENAEARFIQAQIISRQVLSFVDHASYSEILQKESELQQLIQAPVNQASAQELKLRIQDIFRRLDGLQKMVRNRMLTFTLYPLEEMHAEIQYFFVKNTVLVNLIQKMTAVFDRENEALGEFAAELLRGNPKMGVVSRGEPDMSLRPMDRENVLEALRQLEVFIQERKSFYEAVNPLLAETAGRIYGDVLVMIKTLPEIQDETEFGFQLSRMLDFLVSVWGNDWADLWSVGMGLSLEMDPGTKDRFTKIVEGLMIPHLLDTSEKVRAYISGEKLPVVQPQGEQQSRPGQHRRSFSKPRVLHSKGNFTTFSSRSESRLAIEAPEFFRYNMEQGGGSKEASLAVAEKIMGGIITLFAYTMNAAEAVISLLPAALAKKALEASMKLRIAVARKMLGIKTVQTGDVFLLGSELIRHGFLAAARDILGNKPLAVVARSDRDIVVLRQFNEGLKENLQVIIASDDENILRRYPEVLSITAVQRVLNGRVTTGQSHLRVLLYGAETLKSSIPDKAIQRILQQMFLNFLRVVGENISERVSRMAAEFRATSQAA